MPIYKDVTIEFVGKDGCTPYLSLELTDTLISSYSVSGHGGTPIGGPVESLSLNYSWLTYSTKPVQCPTDPKAAKDKAMWNLATGGARSSR
jgi:type VI protein secretion system component Hcp